MLRSKNPAATLFSVLRAHVPALGLVVFAVFAPMPVDAGSATGTATVTVSNEGSVGEVQTPEPEPTPEPAPAATTANDVSTTNGGGAKTPEAAVTQAGVTTFRPLPTLTAPTADAGDGGDTGDSTETSSTGGGDGGGQGAAATGPRLPRGARPVGNLLGGVSAVSVSGSPNQAYGISLPGTTVINQGAQTTVIEGFVHNAGDTPTVSPSGQGSFAVGAKVAGDGEGGGGDAAAGGGEGAAAPNNNGPVIISDPFMDVIIQYN